MTGAFMVERTPDNFDPVKARNFRLDHGDLLLYPSSDLNKAPVIVYARGQWLTFFFDKDYEWKLDH